MPPRGNGTHGGTGRRRASLIAMASALLSCLGVRGWGPLHLWLPERGEPAALWERLRVVRWLERRHGDGDPTAARLLAALLRRQRDLVPLSGPAAAERLPRLRYRHRLVCPPGERSLRLRSWERPANTLPWRACGGELRL